MKITITKKNKDTDITIETEEKIATYKAKILTKTTGICYGLTEDLVYESEVFETTFLSEEVSK